VANGLELDGEGALDAVATRRLGLAVSATGLLHLQTRSERVEGLLGGLPLLAGTHGGQACLQTQAEWRE
jgi:hypothetical protein